MPRQRKSDRRSILIVDDHQLIRQSMADMLRSTFDDTDVIEAEDFADALARMIDPSVFLAIVDLSIPGMTSPLDLEKLRRARPAVRIVVLTASNARSDILAALTAGVHGYIVKNERTERVIAHLKHVIDGKIFVPPILAELTREPTPGAPQPDLPPPQLGSLTKRQKDVLRLITKGMPNKEIGRTLGIAEGTVKMHVTTTLRAIGAANRAHAAAIGKQYLDLP